MMTNPTLRFTQDNGCAFPDWQDVTLGDVSSIIKTRKSSEFLLYVGTEDLIKDFGGLNKVKKEDVSGIYFEKDDILISNIRPYLKKLWMSDEEGIASTDVIVYRSKNIEPSLLKYILSTDSFFEHVAQGYKGSKMPRGDKSQMATFAFQIPFDVKEQQKIAAFFTALDEKIRLSEQKLNLISKIKKGIAQKIFVQDLRFKNKDGYFFDSWKSYTVGELVDVIGGGTPSTLNPNYWDGDIDWLTPTEINSKYVHSSNRKITFDGVKNSSAKLLPKGALLLTTRATLGACSINNQDNPVCTNQGFQSLVCKNGVDNEFMYYVVTDSTFQKAMLQRASGSTFLEISSKNLKGILIHLPSLEEQRQIATLLSSLDKKIDCLKQRVKALKTQKASFMQQMFV